MDLRRRLAEVLRQMRQEAGLTQREAARQLGISQPALARLENADLNTTLDTLTRICRALHCDIGDLIDEHLKDGEPDLAQMAAMIAQSLAEFIMRAPQNEQANLMADALITLGATYLEKPSDEERPHRAH